MPLIPCRRCSRHIRAHEVACPFCATSLFLGTAAAFTLGASALLLACGGPPPHPAPQTDVASIAAADAAPPPSALASTDPVPTAPPPTTPSAAPPATSAAPPPASSRNDPFNMTTTAAYGGPPPGYTPGDPGHPGPGLPTPAISGDVSVTISAATVPIPDADSTVARSRAQLRRCYDVGLRNDPSMAGQVVLSIRIAPTGGVDSVTVTQNGGIGSDVVACMTAAMRRATFSAPGPTGSILALKVACTPHTH